MNNSSVYQELIDVDNYFDVTSDVRIYLDHGASSGYMKEAEKLERNDSEITQHIFLRKTPTKKLRLRLILWVNVSIF